MSPRLFRTVVSLETRKLMSYRADFWLQAVIAFAAELSVAYFLWRAIFETVPAGMADSEAVMIGGLSFEGMLVYYVLALLLGRLVRGQERGETMSIDIYDGSLSRFLIYPTSYVGFKYAAHLGTLLPSVIQLALLGGLAALVFDLPAEMTITPATAAMTVMTVAVGNLLAFLLRYPISGIAFWAENVWSLQSMQRFIGELLGGLLLPLTLFPDWAQRMLAALPFQYLFFVPVQTLTGQRDVAAWLTDLTVALAWCAALALAGSWIWRRGRYRYTGVGI